MLTVLRSNNHKYWTSECRLTTGRSCLHHLLNLIKPTSVLMPCYVPEGIINPVRVNQIPIKFYRLRSDLRPEIDDVRKHVSAGSLVIVIHYFGLITDTVPIYRIVKEADAWLLEDCAHALFHNPEISDFALYSLNKFLPVSDGAILKSRSADISHYPIPSQVGSSKAANFYEAHLTANARIQNCVDPIDAIQLAESSNSEYEFYYREINDFTNFGVAQSKRSKLIESQIDLREMASARSKNVLKLNMHLSESFRWPHAIGPLFAYPIVTLHKERVLTALLECGVLPATLIDKWDHIPKEGFEQEKYFRDHHLLLPVSEEIPSEKMLIITGCLRAFA